MTSLTATEIADRFQVSRARVSQWVSEGKLDGCFTGEGRARRFDPDAVADRLQRALDPGQMLGNGASTRRAIRAEAAGTKTATGRTDGPLAAADPDRYELARIQNAEEDARRKRRDNERDEGRWVLAAEVQRTTARMIGQEVAQFETVLREGARAVADRFGIDYREARAVLMDIWREHRVQRVAALTDATSSATMTAEEQAAQT